MRFRTALLLTYAVIGVIAGGPSAFADDAKPVNITFIISTDPANIFWPPTLKGVADAAKLTGAKVDVQYANFDPARMNDILETALANGVDGVVAPLFAKEAFKANIKKLTDKGIMFVSYNQADPDQNQYAKFPVYVGQDFVSAGEVLGERIVKLGLVKDGDHVFYPCEFPEGIFAAERFQGFLNTLSKAHIKITYDSIKTTDDIPTALSRETEYLVANPKTAFVFTCGGTSGSVAPQAIKEAGLSIKSSTFDTSIQINKGIANGNIVATMDQQPYLLGFYPVVMVANYIHYGLQPSTIVTGNAIVDQSNLAPLEKYTGTYR